MGWVLVPKPTPHISFASEMGKLSTNNSQWETKYYFIQHWKSTSYPNACSVIKTPYLNGFFLPSQKLGKYKDGKWSLVEIICLWNIPQPASLAFIINNRYGNNFPWFQCLLAFVKLPQHLSGSLVSSCTSEMGSLATVQKSLWSTQNQN